MSLPSLLSFSLSSSLPSPSPLFLSIWGMLRLELRHQPISNISDCWCRDQALKKGGKDKSWVSWNLCRSRWPCSYCEQWCQGLIILCFWKSQASISSISSICIRFMRLSEEDISAVIPGCQSLLTRHHSDWVDGLQCKTLGGRRNIFCSRVDCCGRNVTKGFNRT